MNHLTLTTRSRRRCSRLAALCLLCSPVLLAAANPTAKPAESSEGQWAFSFLPKSFQNNPLVDETIITEMTDEGRKVPPPTVEAPAYYEAVAVGRHDEGFAAGTDRAPSTAVLGDCLQRALAVNHYLPAGPGHPPTLLITYLWGVHNNLDAGSRELGISSHDVGHRNLLSRAALVGGAKFAAEFKVALEAQDRENEKPGERIELLQPMKVFLARDARTRLLCSMAAGECYFLVASAYDYQKAARKEGRRLLWRSKLAVDSSGVAMADTLPTLVLNSGGYLGRDMSEAATLLRRITRGAEVKLGPLEMKEFVDPTDTPPTGNKKP